MPDIPAKLLAEYEKKRDFERTAEPQGRVRPDVPGPMFVVQRHDARRLHYDVRLEIEGVLKSWAVPRGPSYDPEHKRLAVMTEDHPMAYADFEGVIPKGEYGGGTVIVWDRGRYVPLDRDRRPVTDEDDRERVAREGLAAGRLRVRFEGEKLQGVWSLVRMQGRSEEDAPWLLIKSRDREADPTREITEDDRSVLTGRTVEDVVAQEGTPAEAARRVRRTARKAPHPYDHPVPGEEGR